MNALISHLIHRIVTHRYIVLFLSILVAVPFLVRLPDIKTIDNVDYFSNPKDPDLIFYEQLKTIFGNDEFFIIAFKTDNLFTPTHLRLLKQLTDELAEMDGIRQIISISNANELQGDKDFFTAQEFLETIPDDPLKLDALKKRAVQNPLYVDNLLSRDGKTAAIVIFVQEKPDQPDFRKQVISRTETILARHSSDTLSFHIAGWTFTNTMLPHYLKKDIILFVPLGYILIALMVFLFYGNIRLTLIAVFTIFLCMGCTMGILPILGIPLNMINIIAPPVVIALALCDTVHIFSAFDKTVFSQYPNREKAYEMTLKKLFYPCFLTSLTTAVGFFSLGLNDIPPINEFAIITSIGMGFEFFFSFTFLPAAMMLFDEKKITHSVFRNRTVSWNMDRYLNFLFEFNRRYSRWILSAGILITCLSVGFSSRIQVEGNLLEYFSPRSPVRISSAFIEKELAGLGTLDISFSATSADAFKKPENLLVIETLQNRINTIEGVDKTMSFVDFIKDMNTSFNNEAHEFYRIPDSADVISQFLLIYEPEDIRSFVNKDYSHARMSIRMSKHSTRDHEEIIRKITAFLATMDINGLDIRISGLALQSVNVIHSLVKGQIYSLAASSMIIFLIMLFAFRSVPLWLLSIFPNLFPIALNFGIMGLFHIPMNEATALISSVVIGIAVDDTIHFVTELKRNLAGSTDIPRAIRQTVEEKGRAIMLSCLILFIGFGVVSFSQFVPTMHFGILSALMMLWAIIGETFLLLSSLFIYLDRARP